MSLAKFIEAHMSRFGTNLIVEIGVDNMSLVDSLKGYAAQPAVGAKNLAKAKVMYVGPEITDRFKRSHSGAKIFNDLVENVLHLAPSPKIIIGKACHNNKEVLACSPSVGQYDVIIDIPCPCNVPGLKNVRNTLERSRLIRETFKKEGYSTVYKYARCLLNKEKDDIVIASKNPNLTNFIDSQFFKLHKAPESFEDVRDMSLLI